MNPKRARKFSCYFERFTASQGYSGDGGPATSAELNAPFSVAIDAAGDFYTADSANNAVREVSNKAIPTVTVTTQENPSAPGQPVTLTASLPSSASGTVTFLNHGLPIPGQSSVTTLSPPSQALDFNGATNYIDLGPSADSTLDFTKTSPFSVSFWMNSTNGAQQMIVGKGAGFYDHSSPGWTVFTAYGWLYFQLNAESTFGVSELQAREITTVVCDGQWHHIVVTYNGNEDISGVTFYIDGVAYSPGSDINDLSADNITNSVDATIGGTPPYGDSPPAGLFQGRTRGTGRLQYRDHFPTTPRRFITTERATMVPWA